MQLLARHLPTLFQNQAIGGLTETAVRCCMSIRRIAQRITGDTCQGGVITAPPEKESHAHRLLHSQSHSVHSCFNHRIGCGLLLSSGEKMIQTETKISRQFKLKLTREQIIAALQEKYVIPDDASMFVHVPGGGDWSNT